MTAASPGSRILKVTLAVILLKAYLLFLLYVLFLQVEPKADYNAFLYLMRGQSRESRLKQVKERFLDRLTPYDGQFYLDIAANGYRRFEPPRKATMHLATTQGNYAFFPLLPLAVRVFGSSHSAAGLAAVLAASVLLGTIACVGLWFLARSLGFPPWLTLGFLLAYPTAIFQMVLYTESLFLFLSVGIALCAARRLPRWAATLGYLGGLCRPQGILLGALSLWRWPEGGNGDAQPQPTLFSRILVSLAPVAGILSFAGLLAFTIGSPLGFIEVQSDWGRRFSASSLFSEALGKDRPGAPIDLLGVLLGLGLVPFLWKKLPRPLALYGTVSALLPLLTGSFLSYGRFLSVSFPHFLCLAKIFERWKVASAVLLAAFVVLQTLIAKGLLAWQFVG